jgi:hypothetical protein
MESVVARSRTYYDLRDACAETGCPVCRLTLRAVSRYIASVDYEYVNEPDVRAEVERAQGFCNTHAQQWLREGHVLAVALVYEGILDRLRRGVERAGPGDRGGRLTAVGSRLGRRGRGVAPDSLRPEGGCPVCRERDETEAHLLRVLGEGLAAAEDDLRAAFRQSDGLCLLHLRLALSTIGNAEAGDALRAATLAHQERLMRQLREIVRKHDYRFRDEPSGEERGAATRAVAHVAGLPGIVDRGG